MRGTVQRASRKEIILAKEKVGQTKEQERVLQHGDKMPLRDADVSGSETATAHGAISADGPTQIRISKRYPQAMAKAKAKAKEMTKAKGRASQQQHLQHQRSPAQRSHQRSARHQVLRRSRR